MKGHVGRSSNVGRLIPYIFRDQISEGLVRAPRIVSGMGRAVPAADVVAEFKAVARLRADVRRPFWHCSLAVNEETLSWRQWADATVSCLEAMGFDLKLHPYVAVHHPAEGLDHCHVVVSRIGIDGSVWVGKSEVFNFIKACQLVERRMGLKVTPASRPARRPAAKPSRQRRAAASRSVIRSNWRAERRGLGKNDGAKLVEDLRSCAAKALDMESFVALAASMEIDLRIVEREDRARRGILVKQRLAGTYLRLSSVTHGELSGPILEDLFVAKAQCEDDRFADLLDDAETDGDDDSEAAGDAEDGEDGEDDESPSPNESGEEGQSESE